MAVESRESRVENSQGNVPESALGLSHATDNVDVNVDVDVVVNVSGHFLVTGFLPCDLGRALGIPGSSFVPSVGRVQVHVHDHVHDHVATYPPDTLTSSQVSRRAG